MKHGIVNSKPRQGLSFAPDRDIYPFTQVNAVPAYIQHSAHIAPGREGLFELVKTAPKELHYENALIVADGDYVMLHSRISGIGQPGNWVVVDILRIENGLIAEHWDVIQDDATRESSKSGRPMFGDKFPA